MTRPSSLLPVLGCLLTSACPPSREPGSDPGPGSSSSSDTEPAASTPTSSGETGTGTTAAGSTSTTSGAMDNSSTAMDESSSGAGSSSSGTDGSSDVTGSSLEDCGNGVIDPGEGCDDGYAENKDDGACTLACQPAVCGDGHVWAGHESCDFGVNNNNTSYNGCTDACEPGPHCGDGIHQIEEECDAGPDNGSGESSPDGVPCLDICRFDAKVVFVTSETYTGKEVGGVTGAHEKCKTLAMKAGLDNHVNFKAFISAVGFIPADAEQFTHANIPYVRVDGVRVADDWEDLVQEGPAAGIVVAENGAIFEDWNVWTGTDSDGGKFVPEQTCEGWTSDSKEVKGRQGRASEPTDAIKWVDDSSAWCNFPANIYCFEQ